MARCPNHSSSIAGDRVLCAAQHDAATEEPTTIEHTSRGRLRQTRPAAAEERYTLQDGRAPASRTRRAHCVRRRPEVQQRPPRTPAQFSRLDSEGTPRRPTPVRPVPTPTLAEKRPPCARRRCVCGPVREARRASATMAAWRRGARRNARRYPHLSESSPADDMARMARPPVTMWPRCAAVLGQCQAPRPRARSRHRCGSGKPSPNYHVARVSPVAGQSLWESRRRGGWGEPSPGCGCGRR